MTDTTLQIPCRDAHSDDMHSCAITVEKDNLGFIVSFPDYETPEGEGPILIEVYAGVPRVLIWDNINATEPTIINLDRAHVKHRKYEQPTKLMSAELKQFEEDALPFLRGATCTQNHTLINAQLHFDLYWDVGATPPVVIENIGVTVGSASTPPVILYQTAFDYYIDHNPADAVAIVKDSKEYADCCFNVAGLQRRGDQLNKEYPGFNYERHLQDLEY